MTREHTSTREYVSAADLNREREFDEQLGDIERAFRRQSRVELVSSVRAFEEVRLANTSARLGRHDATPTLHTPRRHQVMPGSTVRAPRLSDFLLSLGRLPTTRDILSRLSPRLFRTSHVVCVAGCAGAGARRCSVRACAAVALQRRRRLPRSQTRISCTRVVFRAHPAISRARAPALSRDCQSSDSESGNKDLSLSRHVRHVGHQLRQEPSSAQHGARGGAEEERGRTVPRVQLTVIDLGFYVWCFEIG